MCRRIVSGSAKPCVALWVAAALTISSLAHATEGTDRPLTVAEVRALVADGNRDVSLARRSREAALADNLAARARPNPGLTVSTAAINPRAPGAGALWNKPVDAIVQLSQLIERGGKRTLRDDATKLLAAAASADLDDTIRTRTLDATQTYYALLQAQQRVTVAEETAGLLAKTVAAAQLRLAAGDISPTDLARIRVDQLRAENDRRQAAADRDRLRAALAFRLGLEADAGRLVAVDPWPAPEPVEMPADPAAIVADRSDVRAARERVAAADKAAELAQALRTRDVTVTAQYERFPGQIQQDTFGIGVSMPLFLNYDFEGEIRRAEANRLAARDALARTQAAALTDIRQAWSDLSSARDRVRRFDGELLREAGRAADAAEFAYRNGALGVIDLLDARRVFYATRLDAVSAHADLAFALSAWRAATAVSGGGQ
ncbi:MAG: TolC family protein [Betaproteobacteria bacterium]|nr:TolC family protein [Betaproteobacteria bacterium]